MAKTIKELFDLSGKTAIVTGGSRGLGKEMAEGLAEAGASLMLCARRAEWLDETLEEFRVREVLMLKENFAMFQNPSKFKR
ncbi:MAG: SDR family NAD(P)-dependent oxidoreductase [Pyrinomonadaceae bacterium]